jgi:alkylation response protein AidB-like acyl-CoA dehydrogenase
VFGQKIFITFGEHDMAQNIVHLVLARTPEAPEGIKGISLFIVPKFMVGPDGRWASATTSGASLSNTSWASRPAPPPS